MHSSFKDFSSDPGRQLLVKLAAKYDFPEYVLKASESDFETSGNKSKCAQLLPEPRFPTHTKAATWLSYASLMQQRNRADTQEVKMAEEYLVKRAEFWGIKDDLNAIIDREVEMLKQACVSEQAYPVRNEEEARHAAAWLRKQADSHHPDISLIDRVKLARDISEWIEPCQVIRAMTCRYGCHNPKQASETIRSFINDDNEDLLKECALTAEQMTPSQLQESHREIAMIVDKLADHPMPELALATGTLEDVVFLSNGATVKAASLEGLATPSIAAAAASGKPTIGEPSDRAVKLASEMPKDLADKLCQELRESGIDVEVEPGFEDISVLEPIENRFSVS